MSNPDDDNQEQKPTRLWRRLWTKSWSGASPVPSQYAGPALYDDDDDVAEAGDDDDEDDDDDDDEFFFFNQ